MPGLARVLALTFLAVLQSSEALPQEAAPCAATLGELKGVAGDRAFPLQWQETTMNDGKPLLVSIHETEGALSLAFTKTGEGVWAESTGAICRIGAGLEARFGAGQIRLGPAASWVVRYALQGGGTFTLTRLGPGRLRIATRGWSGIFVPGGDPLAR